MMISSLVIYDDPKAYLLGKWEMIAYDLKITIDGEDYYNEEDIPDGGVEYHFKPEGVVDYRFFDSDTGEDEEVGTGTYQKTDDELVIFRDDIPYSFSISLLNKTRHNVKSFEEGTDEEGRYIEIEITQKFVKM